MESEDWKCPLGTCSFRSKGGSLGGTIHMSLKHPDYAESSYHYEREKYRRQDPKQLHATVPRCRLRKRGRLAIDSLTMRLQESEVESEHL